MEDRLVWKRDRWQKRPNLTVLYLPRKLIPQVLGDAYGATLSGHDWIAKTREPIAQCHYWSGMDADIQKHLQDCHHCQARRTQHHAEPLMLLTPLPPCTEPQQQVHADLFSPLKTKIGKSTSSA